MSTSFYGGWLGFGTAFIGLTLSEPTDGSYARRPIAYGPLVGGHAPDLSAGTIGPAGMNWGTLAFAGIFDAAQAGNLIACWPLARPMTLAVGSTSSQTSQFGMYLPDTANGPVVGRPWLAGSQIGVTEAGLPVTACQNLQVIAGVLTSLGLTGAFGSLPTTAPASGSGVLWNNGGVICVA